MANYRVTINPDADFASDQIVKLLVDAKDMDGNSMDQLAAWFRTPDTPITPGNNYRVAINPMEDFSRNQIVKLQIDAKDNENNPMDTLLTWFRALEFYPGYRVMVNPDAAFGEMETVEVEISATDMDLMSLLETFWFQTEHFDVLVDILPGYPDVSISRWETNKDVGTYQVEVGGNGKGTGVIIGTAFGSQNVQGNLPGILEAIETVIKGADLEAASLGSDDKRLNIYVTDAGGYFNDYEG